jgi:hypothetical protein
MNTSILLTNKLEKGRQKVFNKSRLCLVENCDKKAIGSHVLQQEGILNNIIDDTNHFYSVDLRSIFKMKENDFFEIKKMGINKCYKFPGFCNHHDSQIFKSIETHPIDFSNPKSLQLFSYRAVCLEYRKKEIYLELVKNKIKIYKEVFPAKLHYIDLKPAEQAIRDLAFYKNEFEKDLMGNSNSNFDLTLIELPYKKVCFSTTLTISDEKNEYTFEYDKYGYIRTEPLAISILNYFPYNDKSYLIVAVHKKYFCNWTKELIKNFKNKKNIDKTISDLLTYRLELWGISPEIYEKIPANKIEQFKIDSHIHWDNYDYNINSDFNLFD